MRASSDRPSFGRDSSGVGAVEFALLAPLMLLILALTVWASQALTLDRKLTQATRTLIDLAAQQSNIGASSGGFTYSQILAAVPLIIVPFDKAPLGMVLSEVKVTGPASGTVIWSQASGGATALAVGATATISDSSANWTGGPGYLLLGTITYNFQPFGGLLNLPSLSLTRTSYMAPYNNDSVQCCS
jgi:Flp pilus assembly protein TadG